MIISIHTQTILLLTAYFSKPSQGDVKPLTPSEWGRFAHWLQERKIVPEDLMTADLQQLLDAWVDKNITLERLKILINRGPALALAMDKWMRAGLWVMTRSDKYYPARLKTHLKLNSPALLFGCGNMELLNLGGIAVVGSRDASDENIEFTRKLGVLAAGQGYSVVSGGARGIDEAAMISTLESEGTSVGILANSLLQSVSTSKYRKYLMNNSLVLVSPFYPEAGFSVGATMARNKYIYCLSDAAVVVQSGLKGGTWSGALENLKRDWVPLWVKETNDPGCGNEQIVKRGGAWISDEIEKLSLESLTKRDVNVPKDTAIPDLFSWQKNQADLT
jgi:predicted Rossmann fold nucleotide-binding protein DprA/Smf involved in DNA uptake